MVSDNPHVLKFDGSCDPNPGRMGIGVVILDGRGELVLEISKEMGDGTNNRAEYLAILTGLQELVRFHSGGVVVQGDSDLAIKQLTGEWRVKDREIRNIFDQVKGLEAKFDNVEYEWVSRESNKAADVLSAKALGLDLSRRDDASLSLSVGNTYEVVFGPENQIEKHYDKKYDRDVWRFPIKEAYKNGKKVKGTYFETGANDLRKKLGLLRPLEGKRIRILPMKEQTWTKYLVEDLT